MVMDTTRIFAASPLFNQGYAASTAGRVCDLTFPLECQEVLDSGARGQIASEWFSCSFGLGGTLIPSILLASNLHKGSWASLRFQVWREINPMDLSRTSSAVMLSFTCSSYISALPGRAAAGSPCLKHGGGCWFVLGQNQTGILEFGPTSAGLQNCWKLKHPIVQWKSGAVSKIFRACLLPRKRSKGNVVWACWAKIKTG